MNALALLGAAGVGVTWGWMLGWLAGGERPARTSLAAIGASLLVVGVVAIFAGPAGAAASGVAAAVALPLHLATRGWGGAHSH